MVYYHPHNNWVGFQPQQIPKTNNYIHQMVINGGYISHISQMVQYELENTWKK